MRASQTSVLNLRLPGGMRAALDTEARIAGTSVSAATRAALAAGLKAIRQEAASNDHDGGPRPAGPAAAMRAAA